VIPWQQFNTFSIVNEQGRAKVKEIKGSLRKTRAHKSKGNQGKGKHGRTKVNEHGIIKEINGAQK
jgi:hypothetical protein